MVDIRQRGGRRTKNVIHVEIVLLLRKYFEPGQGGSKLGGATITPTIRPIRTLVPPTVRKNFSTLVGSAPTVCVGESDAIKR